MAILPETESAVEGKDLFVASSTYAVIPLCSNYILFVDNSGTLFHSAKKAREYPGEVCLRILEIELMRDGWQLLQGAGAILLVIAVIGYQADGLIIHGQRLSIASQGVENITLGIVDSRVILIKGK